MATVDPTCPKVLNMLVLDSDGRRMAVKYFSPEWCVRAACRGSCCWGDGPGQPALPEAHPAFAVRLLPHTGPQSTARQTMKRQCLPRPAEQTPGKKVGCWRPPVHMQQSACWGPRQPPYSLSPSTNSTPTQAECSALGQELRLQLLILFVCLLWYCVVCTAEIIMFDDYLVVYKQLGDLMFYVTGSLAENELILHAVLQAFYEATSTLLRCAGALAALPLP